MMISFNQFVNTKIDEQEIQSIYKTPDKAKAVAAMNQAISQLPSIISSLKDLAQKLETASLNNTKVQNSAESLQKLLDSYKTEITA